MGVSFSALWSRLFNSTVEIRILMVGLDAAGKTTILYKLKLGEGTSQSQGDVNRLAVANVSWHVLATKPLQMSPTINHSRAISNPFSRAARGPDHPYHRL